MTDPQEKRAPGRSGLPRYARVILGIVGVLAVLIVGAAIAVNLYVTGDRVEAMINDELRPATDGELEARVESARVGIIGRSLTLGGLSITPTDEAEQQPLKDLQIERFRISGIGVLNYLRHGRIAVNAIQIEQPSLQMEVVEQEEVEAELHVDDLMELAEEEPLAGTRIRTIQITDADVELIPGDDVDDFHHTIEGLSLTIDDLHLDREIAEAEDRFLFARNMEVELDRYHVLTADELYMAEMHDLSASTSNSVVSIETMSMEPAVADRIIFDQEPWGVARYEIEMRGLQMEGLDLEAMLEEHPAVRIQAASLDSLYADIFYEETEVDPPPPDPYPHELLQELDMLVAIDEVQLHHGHVQYAELVPGADAPGVIMVEDVAATGTHIFSAPDERAEQPVVFDVQGLVQGEGTLEAHIEYDLTDPTFHMDLHGTLGEMPFEPFNEMLVDRAGIRIDSGDIHEAIVDVSVRDNVAEGRLHFLYENLDVEILDELIEIDFVQELGEIIANELLRTDTVPPEEVEGPHVATAQVERDPEEHPFGLFLALPLMEAMLDVLGRDRLPV